MNRNITPVVLALIIINAAVHLFFWIGPQSFAGYKETLFTLWKVDTFGWHDPKLPSGYPDFNWFQILGSAFSHSDRLFHILMNMMCLFFFGPALEKRMGSVWFAIYYLFCAIVGGIIVAFLALTGNPVLGASGAICGLLVGFAWLFPESKMGLLFIPVYIASRKFTAGFAVFSIAMIIIDRVTGKAIVPISHFGHLAGMVAGLIFMLVIGRRFVRRFPPSSQPSYYEA